MAVAFKEKENAVIRANDLLEETKWVQLLLVVEGRGLCYFRHTSTSFTWWYRFHYEGYDHMFFVRRKARDGHWHICIPHGFGVVVCGSVPWVLAGCRPRCIQLCLFTTIRINGFSGVCFYRYLIEFSFFFISERVLTDSEKFWPTARRIQSQRKIQLSILPPRLLFS